MTIPHKFVVPQETIGQAPNHAIQINVNIVGRMIGANHFGRDCCSKAEGHKGEATKENRMGGNTRNLLPQ